MRKIEILSPAGGPDSLPAAVCCGADAVYLGAELFSARAGATNFSREELKRAIRYCHIRDVKVYLTLNTLIFDDELQQALDLITFAAESDVDAVIVQDIGLAGLIKKTVPKLALHGSTQMSVHTPAGAKFLWELGFKRVVLARELNKKEIKEIVESCPIETEVFVHGAMCYSVSGQCLFSAVLGGRSGNRGQCAQPCRLPFSVLGSSGGNSHALSLKDNSLLSHLDELCEIGVTSAKIEGRMKRPEYVAAATAAFFEQREFGCLTSETFDRLNRIFSRSGFTDGYYTGKIDKNMFGIREHSDVVSADSALLKSIKNTYAAERKKVGVTMNFKARLNEPPSLSCSDGKNSVRVVGDSPCVCAEKLPLTKERVTAQLEKTGGTPYFIEQINTEIDKDASLSAAEINALRRKAFEKLDNTRAVWHDYQILKIDLDELLFKNRPRSVTKKGKTRAYLKNGKIPPDAVKYAMLFLPLFAENSKFEKLMKSGAVVGAEIPRLMFGREKEISERISELKKIGILNFSAGNLGAVKLCLDAEVIIHGGATMNLTNTASLLWAEDIGFADVELSSELTVWQIEKLGGSINRGAQAYGYLPLMAARVCPGKSDGISCCSCKKRLVLQDRKKAKSAIFCHENYIEILNSLPLIAPEKLINSTFIDFTFSAFYVENHVENVDNTPVFMPKNAVEKKFTRGLYTRGVK